MGLFNLNFGSLGDFLTLTLFINSENDQIGFLFWHYLRRIRVHSPYLPFFAHQAYDFLQEDSLSEKSRHQRMKEQKEQYKQV